MKVAVLMSTYNGEKYLREQIESILAQEIDAVVDLWVRDDGSTDGTHDILRLYESDNRLHWYIGENVGPAKSFLDLLKHCPDYDFYAFADQDDFWMSEKISVGIKCVEAENVPTLYVGNAELVDAELNSLGRNVYKHIPRTDFKTVACAGGLLGCTMIFNKQLACVIQDRKISEYMVMHDFFVALVCLAIGGKIIFDKNSYIKYRQHGNNTIGVPTNYLNTLKSRIADITRKAKISIAEQAQSVLNLYQDEIVDENKLWLKTIAGYRANLWCRIQLAFSIKTKYSSMNMAIKIRMAILLNNL